MSLSDLWNTWRDRTNPDRAERAARAAGKSEAEVAEARRKADRRKKLLRSGAISGGSSG